MVPFITMDAFEEIDEDVKKLDMPEFFYSIEDIEKHIKPNIQECLPFAIKLSQQKPKTDYEKETRRYLLNLLNETIIFDEEEKIS